jgi:hypothetical protein
LRITGIFTVSSIDFNPQSVTQSLIKFYLYWGLIMKKSALTIVLLASCLAFGACSSYPTWVPEWAQVGAK